MDEEEFNRLLADVRPRLFRYCARMTGSSIDGEDVVQDAFASAIAARAAAPHIDNPESWLFRIAHNAAIDFLRRRSRAETAPLDDVFDMAAPESDTVNPDLVAVSFRTFMQLPTQQRCAVILKDVLGHSIEEIAAITDTSVPATKSALQRGRAQLKDFAHGREDVHLPLLSDAERRRLFNYVDLFRSGDFDAIRQLLADDVKLDLVARLKLQGRHQIGRYFTGYAEATHWRFAAGTVDGQPVMLVFDANRSANRPAHFVVLDWQSGRIASIRDFLFAPYALETSDWLRLS
jgi:RNA polymerase sigma factor (sigma-70 family)